MKRIALAIILFALMCLFSANIFACTIFTAKNGDTVLVGNNEDYFYHYSSDMWFTAPSEGSYGRVCFANSGFVQGGMNEKGLFYDGALCPNTQVPNSPDKPSLGMDMGEIVLSKCANVDEVVEMLKGYNIPRNLGDHLMFVDESGSSVIIEWVENEMVVVPGETDFQAATNFFITKPELGGYPCSRYTAVERMLTECDELSVGVFSDILDAVSQQWAGGGTKYSNIYDLKRRVVYVYTRSDFSKYAEFHLEDELKKLKKGERADYNIDLLSYKAVGEETTGAEEIGGAVETTGAEEADGAVETGPAAADGSVTDTSNENSSSHAELPKTGGHVPWWHVALPAAAVICGASFILILRKNK